MPSWRKLLARMVADRRPRSYSYQDAARILQQLGFTLATPTDGSHRKWRVEVSDSASASGTRRVTVGLVDRGNGTMKPVYVLKMVEVLQANRLIPDDTNDDLDD